MPFADEWQRIVGKRMGDWFGAYKAVGGEVDDEGVATGGTRFATSPGAVLAVCVRPASREWVGGTPWLHLRDDDVSRIGRPVPRSA